MSDHALGNFSGIASIILLMFATVTFAATTFDSFTPQNAAAEQGEGIAEESPLLSDQAPPSVRILTPSACTEPIGSEGVVMASGIAASNELAVISKVEAFSHTYPFDGEYPFELATPSAGGDWSSWSIPVQIYQNATRILVRVTDNAGMENWDEVIINPAEGRKLLEIQNHDPDRSIAFVEPSFTEAAYGVGGFYEFYAKHQGVRFDEVVTTDLDLMVSEIPSRPDRSYFEPILQRVEEFLPPQAAITVISDVHVHDGLIFMPDGSNSFRALFLLHNEYVTQQEYDNFRRFVENGGTLVFVDSNAFYAEVSYDRENCTVTLVKGHDWEYDSAAGTVVRSVSERYEAENREWVGTNYMVNALWDPVYFTNAPFNLTHFEENYVSNPNATILHDFGMKIGEGYESEDWHRNQKVVTYEMRYMDGKIIGLGIYGQNYSNDARFLDFFERVVLMRALGNEYVLHTGDDEYPVYWKMNSGQVVEIQADSNSSRLVLNVQTGQDADTLRLALPRDLIDTAETGNGSSGARTNADEIAVDSVAAGTNVDLQSIPSGAFQVTTKSADGAVQLDTNSVLVEYRVDSERYVEIPIKPGTATVEIFGSYVAPELASMSGALLVLGLGLASLVLMRKFSLS